MVQSVCRKDDKLHIDIALRVSRCIQATNFVNKLVVWVDLEMG